MKNTALDLLFVRISTIGFLLVVRQVKVKTHESCELWHYCTSKKQDAAVQQEADEKLRNNEQLIVKTKKQQLSKKRKWNDAFTQLGFVKDSDENYPSARCVFCQVVYHNSLMEKYKMKRHKDTKHSEHITS